MIRAVVCLALVALLLASFWNPDSMDKRAEVQMRARGLVGCVLSDVKDAHRIIACGTQCQRHVATYTYACVNGSLSLDYP